MLTFLVDLRSLVEALEEEGSVCRFGPNEPRTDALLDINNPLVV